MHLHLRVLVKVILSRLVHPVVPPINRGKRIFLHFQCWEAFSGLWLYWTELIFRNACNRCLNHLEFLLVVHNGGIITVCNFNLVIFSNPCISLHINSYICNRIGFCYLLLLFKLCIVLRFLTIALLLQKTFQLDLRLTALTEPEGRLFIWEWPVESFTHLFTHFGIIKVNSRILFSDRLKQIISRIRGLLNIL